MSTGRWVGLLLAAALGAALYRWWPASDRGELAERAVPRSLADASGGAPTPPPPQLGPRDAAERAAAPEQGEPEAEPAADAGFARLRVIDGETLEGLAGIEVYALGRAQLALAPAQPFAPDDVAEHQFRERGARAITGADGRADVALSERAGVALARSGSRFGFCRVATAAALGNDHVADLALFEDAAFEVEVVDEAGMARPDVPVRLVEVTDGGYHPIYDAIFQAAAEPGRLAVRIPHARAVLADGLAPEGAPSYYLAPAIAGWNRQRRELDPRALPERPLRLVVPPLGRVRVRAEDPSGAPYAAPVDFRAVFGSPHGDSELRLRGESGEVVFQHVACDWPFFGYAVPLDRRFAQVEIRQGALCPSGGELALTVRLRDPTESFLVLRGRLLDEASAPVAAAAIAAVTPPQLARSDAPLSARDRECETSQDGTFELLLRPPGHRADELQLAVFRDQRMGLLDASRSAPLALPPEQGAGLYELGDVRLERVPVLAAGRVLLAGGAPLAGATVQALFLRPGEESAVARALGNPGQPRRMAYSGRTDAAGRFALHGVETAAEGKLTVRAEGTAVDIDPFRRGAADLEVVIAAAGSVAGRLVGIDGIPLSQLRLSLRGAGGGRTSGASPDPAGAFRFGAVPQGEHALAISIEGEEQHVLDVPGLLVEPGAPCSDPRLAAIDLAGRLAVARLEVVHARGAPARGAVVSIANRGLKGEALDGNGRATLLTGPEGLSAFIVDDGTRFVQLAGARGNLRVELPDGIPLEVRLPEDVRIPAGMQLRVAAAIVAPAPDPIAEYRFRVDSAGARCEGVAALLRLPDAGRWRITAFAQIGGRSEVRLDGAEIEATITEASGSALVHLPLAQATLDGVQH